MSKIVEIRRHFNMIEMQQEDPQVQAWLGESYRPVGPYFKSGGKAVATGIDITEQKVLMPEILSMEVSDKDYRKKVEDYFHGLVTNIPKTGLALEVGLRDDSKPLDQDNLPINPVDYIIYRHALNHPHVGHDKSDAERHSTKRFYLVDKTKAQDEAVKISSLEDEATTLYFKYKDDLVKTHQILTMMGINIKGLTKDDQTLKMKDFTRKDSKLNEVEQTQVFKRFIEVAKDQDIEMKYLVQEMIGAQYLKQVGNSIMYNESGKVVGESLQDAVHYFKNPKNSRELNLLRAEYTLKVKKGDEYLPKDGTVKSTISQKTEE